MNPVTDLERGYRRRLTVRESLRRSISASHLRKGRASSNMICGLHKKYGCS